jgi:hypothetical protein
MSAKPESSNNLGAIWVRKRVTDANDSELRLDDEEPTMRVAGTDELRRGSKVLEDA